MNATVILYPSVAMFALTLGCLFALGISRYRAIGRGEVRISYFRTYNEGEQTQRLHLMSRHVQNHFEVPPLFHIGIILLYVTGAVGTVAVALAWLFVAARYVHSFIHLGSNNVTHRFFVFATSLVILGALWVTLAISLIGAGG